LGTLSLRRVPAAGRRRRATHLFAPRAVVNTRSGASDSADGGHSWVVGDSVQSESSEGFPQPGTYTIPEASTRYDPYDPYGSYGSAEYGSYTPPEYPAGDPYPESTYEPAEYGSYSPADQGDAYSSDPYSSANYAYDDAAYGLQGKDSMREASYSDAGLFDAQQEADYVSVTLADRDGSVEYREDVEPGQAKHLYEQHGVPGAVGLDSPQTGEPSQPADPLSTARTQDDALSDAAVRSAHKRSRRPSGVDAEHEPVALRVAVLFLPRELRRDWREEQRCYLLDLSSGPARRAWIVSLVLGLPGLALATRLRPEHEGESA
jgi:hypothetical protein